MTRFVMITALLIATFTAVSISAESACAAGSGSAQVISNSGGIVSSSASPASTFVSRGPWPRPPRPPRLGREPEPVPPGELTIRVPIAMWLGIMF